MKFIKDADDFYVDVEKATAFAVVPYRSVNGNLLWADASLFIGELKYKLGRFNDEAEAQSYLDEIVTELNDAKELKCQRHADNLKILDAVINRLEAIT